MILKKSFIDSVIESLSTETLLIFPLEALFPNLSTNPLDHPLTHLISKTLNSSTSEISFYTMLELPMSQTPNLHSINMITFKDIDGRKLICLNPLPLSLS